MRLDILKRVQRAGYQFSTDTNCLVCGKTFKSQLCPHTVLDNDAAIKVAEEERLLR